MRHSTFAALMFGALLGLGAQLALAQPINGAGDKFRNLTVTGTENARLINAGVVDAGSVVAQFIDAGTIKVNGPLNMNANTIYYPGTEVSKYLLLACDNSGIRIGAQCSGGSAGQLDFYATTAGNLMWSINNSGHLIPAGATQKVQLSNNAQSCTLDGASPSKCAITVTASAKCVCSVIGTGAPPACGVNLVTTTLTAYSANGLTSNVNVICDR